MKIKLLSFSACVVTSMLACKHSAKVTGRNTLRLIIFFSAAHLIWLSGCRGPAKGLSVETSGVSESVQDPKATNEISGASLVGPTDFVGVPSPFISIIAPLDNFTATKSTAGIPQSKIWTHDNKSWCVMPISTGTWVFRLDNKTWQPVLKLSALTTPQADVVVSGNLAHVLLYVNQVSYLAHIEYITGLASGYRMRTAQPAVTTVFLDTGVELATLAKDSTNRMWIITDIKSIIVARNSVAPYTTWSKPFVVATGVSTIDIAGVATLPDNSIGVFWSNQNLRRFGFRIHKDLDPPTTWKAEEIPASSAVLTLGAGMADSQFNLTTTSDGTLYAAVKTKYNTLTQPQIGLLVRRPTGIWDQTLYPIDNIGIKPVVSVSSDLGIVRVLYSSAVTTGKILMREAKLSDFKFSSARSIFTSGWNNPTVMKSNFARSMTFLASNNTTIGSAIIAAQTERLPDIFVPYDVAETPAMTSVRLQEAIDLASTRHVGIILQRHGIFITDRQLLVTSPGPLYIDGQGAIIKKVASPDPVIRVISAQDGFALKNLRIFASDGLFSQNQSLCTMAWPTAISDHGIIINDANSVTIRDVSVKNANKAAILVQPLTQPILGLNLENVVLKYNGEGIRLLGSSVNKIRSVNIQAVQIAFMKGIGLSLTFVEDLLWKGGAIEATIDRGIDANDSKRLTFYTYSENFGGWQIQSLTPRIWCPRSPTVNAIMLTRTDNVRFRGRLQAEAYRGAGPLLGSVFGTCYEVGSEGQLLYELKCGTSGVIPPKLSQAFEWPSNVEYQEGSAVIIDPTDSFTVVLTKFGEAATKRLGVILVPNANYAWPMLALAGNLKVPAYIDGRGATITVTAPASGIPYEAAVKIENATNWIGRDKFYIQNLNVIGGGNVEHGILIVGGQSVVIKQVSVTGAKQAGVRGEGRPETGFYYNEFADITVSDSGRGVEIVSTIEGKYANANYVKNIRTVSVPIALSLNWTAATVFSNISADWTKLAAGTPRFILDVNFSSDVEIRDAQTPGTTQSAALIRRGVRATGININYGPAPAAVAPPYSM